MLSAVAGAVTVKVNPSDAVIVQPNGTAGKAAVRTPPSGSEPDTLIETGTPEVMVYERSTAAGG